MRVQCTLVLPICCPSFVANTRFIIPDMTDLMEPLSPKAAQRIEAIMMSDVVAVLVTTDQEEVAEMVIRYDYFGG